MSVRHATSQVSKKEIEVENISFQSNIKSANEKSWKLNPSSSSYRRNSALQSDLQLKYRKSTVTTLIDLEVYLKLLVQ